MPKVKPTSPKDLEQQLMRFYQGRVDPAWIHQQIINQMTIPPDARFQGENYAMPQDPSGPNLDPFMDLRMPMPDPRSWQLDRDMYPGTPPGPFKPGFEPGAQAPDINQALQMSLASLSGKQREAYKLQQAGLNQSEIGRSLGISQVAARKRLLLALKNLPQNESETNDAGI